MISGQKKCSFLIIVLFLAFCALKSRFQSLLWGFNPLLRPKVPPRSPNGLIPLSSCITSATNRNTDIVCEFGSFFFIFSHCKYFWGHFWPFLTPHCASNWAQGPHMDLNPEVYYLSVESAKQWTLIIDSVQFFDFFSFKVIFSHFGPLGGSLGPPTYSWGPPRAPMRCLTSIATLTPGLEPPPVQLGKLVDFWGLPTLRPLGLQHDDLESCHVI